MSLKYTQICNSERERERERETESEEEVWEGGIV